MVQSRARLTRRQMLRAGAGSLFIPFTLTSGKAPAQGGKKPFEGVTLNISCWSATYPKLLADYLPEFTEQTGIKVNYDTPGFPVYNQRADLELSTKGSGFDVLNVTFIFTSRWIGAGWLTPLDTYLKDPNKTPADWDYRRFPGGLRAADARQGRSDLRHPLDLRRADGGLGALRHPQGQRPGHARYASTNSTRRCRSSTRRRALNGFLDREPLGLDFSSPFCRASAAMSSATRPTT